MSAPPDFHKILVAVIHNFLENESVDYLDEASIESDLMERLSETEMEILCLARTEAETAYARVRRYDENGDRIPFPEPTSNEDV